VAIASAPTLDMTWKKQEAVLAAIAALVGLIAFAAASFWMGARLVAPMPAEMPPPPDGFRAVDFPSASGSRISGWLYPDGRCGTVILLHGVRANRTSMTARAELFAGQGHSVLLFDFQGHGESPGEHITFGHLESRDAAAAVAFVEALRPGEPIAAVGSSLGGAAALVGSEPLPLDALVVEAVYPTLRDAVDRRIRMRLGPLSKLLTPVLLAQMKPRLGFSPDDLRPVDGIARISHPVLVVAGSKDEHTTPADSRRLFAAAPEPKELWMVEGAGHVDFQRHAPDRYREVVGGFLRRSMGCQASQ
jgi:fermentation-respiration switch protein FrsA (DUF1100 family)